MFCWRIQAAVLCYCACLWLCRELWHVTRDAFQSVALLLMAACTASSIFWSLKIATENTAETLLYVYLASLLRAHRTQSGLTWLVVGGITVAATLNRPACATLIVPAVAVALAIRRRVSIWRTLGPLLAGLLLAWAPWCIRGAVRYGAFLPLTTQAPYSFLSELGEFSVVIDGHQVGTSLTKLQIDHRSEFENDYQSMCAARMIAWAWITQNPGEFAYRAVSRAAYSTLQDTVALTRVRRSPLAESPVARWLPDRGVGQLILGAIGMIWLARKHRILLLSGISILLPWSASICFIGAPRLLDPAIPLLLHAACCFAVSTIKGLIAGRISSSKQDSKVMTRHRREQG